MSSQTIKIIGYGVVGPGEADRYMEQTLREFDRLCDHAVFVLNGAGQKEIDLIDKYSFDWYGDSREWGVYQPQIKEFLVKNITETHNPDWFIAMDMDERFDKHLTRQSLEKLVKKGHKAYHTHVINLWDEGYNPRWSFDKVQIWKNEPDLGYEFSKKRLHCGLVPEWAALNAAYAPYMLIHYGLRDKKNRERKAERYKKYDPDAQFKGREYYDALTTMAEALPFDEDEMHEWVTKEVESFIQPIREVNMTENRKYYYVRNPHGNIVDVPDYQLDETLKRDGFELAVQEPVVVGGGSVKSTESVRPKKVEEPKEDDTTCGECGFVSKSAFGLRAHMRKHE